MHKNPSLRQFFSIEFPVPRDLLIQGLLSSIILYIDRYGFAVNYTRIPSNSLNDLIDSFLLLAQGSFSRYSETINHPILQSFSYEISKILNKFSSDQKIYNSKVLITLANIFGVVFKEISKKTIRTFGVSSKNLIIIWLYRSSKDFFILFSENPLMIQDDLIYTKKTSEKLRSCGHKFSGRNDYIKCKDCGKEAYDLELPKSKSKPDLKVDKKNQSSKYSKGTKLYKYPKDTKQFNDSFSQGAAMIIDEDFLKELIKLFLSSDLVAEIITSYKDSNFKNLSKLNRSLKTLKESSSLKSALKVINSSLKSFENYLNDHSKFNEISSSITFLSLAFTLVMQFIIVNKTSIVKYGFHGNFRAFLVLLNIKDKIKIKTILPDKTLTQNFKNDEKRFEKIKRRLEKKKEQMLRLCCGCIFDLTELKLLKYKEISEKFTSKCQIHKKSPNRLELSLVFKHFSDFHEGCSACNAKNSLAQCTSCSFSYCSEICQDYLNIIKLKKLDLQYCAFCMKQMTKKNETELITMNPVEFGNLHSSCNVKEYLSISTSAKNKKCLACNILPQEAHDLCKICYIKKKRNN